MNDVIRAGAAPGLGLGEAIGRAILDGDFPHKDVSVLAAAVRLGVPVTVHVGIGYDIIHEHPNCDGAALGQTSYQRLPDLRPERHAASKAACCSTSAPR